VGSNPAGINRVFCELAAHVRGPLAECSTVADARICRDSDGLDRARFKLDHYRIRASRGWKTAAAFDVALPPASGVIWRAVFYETACQAIARAVEGLESVRERRRAEREAILATLQSFR
jgi:RNA:NAD 2'-phosphotransferase (TPT1/KptA family)